MVFAKVKANAALCGLPNAPWHKILALVEGCLRLPLVSELNEPQIHHEGFLVGNFECPAVRANVAQS
jgi:hypothetical protein